MRLSIAAIKWATLSVLFTLLCVGSSHVSAQPFGGRQQAPTPDHYVLLHAGTLLAEPGKAPRGKSTLVIKNNLIERVVDGFLDESAIQRKAIDTIEIIDLSDRFVLPGLMDAHVHLRSQPERRRRQEGRTRDMPADYAVNAVVFARRTLAAGFTTVRDLGSDNQSVFAVRDAINAGFLVGPRILAAGPSLSVTGGHGDPTHSNDPSHRMEQGVCDGADDCRRMVRGLYKMGADVVKYMSTGGFASQTGLKQQMFAEEMQAIIETAHQLDMKVTTHAYDPEAIKDALRAGADSIEHGFLMDDEGIALMKQKGAWLVPTLSAAMPPPIFGIKDAPSVAMRAEYAAFERAYKAGAKIAFGSDVGTFSHGQSAKEFDYMVEFGMSEADAIYAATVSTAELFGLSDKVGTLVAGKHADIIALTKNPLKDISAFHSIDFVMKDGQIAKREGAMLDPFSYPPFRNN